MTARRALFAVAHTALGAAVLAAVVGVLWALGSAGPDAGHVLRVVWGVALVGAAVGAVGVAVGLIRFVHDIGRAIVDAIAGRLR